MLTHPDIPVLEDFVRVLLLCGNALHLRRTTRVHFDHFIGVPAEVSIAETSVEDSPVAVAVVLQECRGLH